MTPDLMAARLAQIEAELKDLAAQVGDGTDEDLRYFRPRRSPANLQQVDELGKEREALVQLLTDTRGSTLT